MERSKRALGWALHVAVAGLMIFAGLGKLLGFAPPEVFEGIRVYGERLGTRLSESARPVILQIKSACWRHPEYRRGFSSSDIYAAVLDHGVIDIEGFWTFLRQRNRVV